MGRVFIKLETNAADILRRLKRLPDDMKLGMRAAMDAQNQETIGWTKLRRLTGKGPFPVGLHQLGERTSQLRRALRASKAKIAGNTVVSEIGNRIRYAAVHEYGFTGSVNVPQHTVRSHMRRMFGKSRRKRVSAHERGPYRMMLRIPARAPVAHGIQDKVDSYGQALSRAIVSAWQRASEETTT
jgi:hypothetical protein